MTESEDFKAFDDAFVYDVPKDAVGFFMYAVTGKPFYFSSPKDMKRELKLAAQYAECHGVRFDPDIVFDELISRAGEQQCEVYTGREEEKKEKKCGYDAA